MQLRRIALIYILLFATFPLLLAENDRDTLQKPHRSAWVDTIVNNAMKNAPRYADIVRDYHSDLYVKGRVYVRKKNLLVRFVPSMFSLKKGVKEYLVESYSDLHFTAPNVYDQKVKAVYGTVDKYRGIEGDVLDYFHVNIYAPFLLHSKLLSPLSPAAKKYYAYRIDAVMTDNEHTSYRITFTPRNRSYQLVEGYMVISDRVWSIRELQFSGRSEYLRFHNLIRMGDVDTDSEFLPQRYDLNTTFHFMGNTIDGSYTAMLDYRSIVLKGEEEKEREEEDEGFFTWKGKNKYDLTDSYNLQNDTTQYYTDSLTFDKLRPLPLSLGELHVYEKYYLHRDTMPVKNSTPSRQFWGQMGDMLTSNYTVNLNAIGSVKCSPLINPFLVSYSGRDGFSYRQEFKYNRLFTHDRILRVAARLGYNFKHREFYWRATGDYDYWPRKRASLHLRVGNGNRIYTSEVLDDIKETADTIFDFDKIHLDYFKDFYVDFRHRIEVVNGVHIDVGLSTHIRTAGKKSDFTPVGPSSDVGEKEIADKFRNEYRSFAPRIVLSWTPGQYYYMNGKRKVNLHSEFPTFSVDWERGMKGIFKSTGIYERVEFDVQHNISLGLMQTLYYRAGMGAFTDQDQPFFVDFVNFSRNNLPVGWNDEIGGVFQLLDRRWYNASLKYLRANVTYEAPFLIMPRLLKRTRNVLNERLYLGALTMPHLNPYIEMGYGIGTHIFDLGVFVSNINGKFTGVGFKFTFELFNR
jgi:hypothetical protein